MKSRPAAADLESFLKSLLDPADQHCLSSRLEAVRTMLLSEPWQLGVHEYLRGAAIASLNGMLDKSLPTEQYNYARGFLAAVRLLLSLPRTIESQIAANENRPSPTGRGDAGY